MDAGSAVDPVAAPSAVGIDASFVGGVLGAGGGIVLLYAKRAHAAFNAYRPM